jgi:GNAT superfamily N-acetyltransferase
MVNIRIAVVHNPEDLKLKAEPYLIKGRAKVSFNNEKWAYEIINFPKVVQDEVQPIEYDYEKYAAKYLILGAYCDDKCVGFALVEKESRTRYLYVKEVRTDKDYVNMGIGTKLLQRCFDEAQKLGYRGLYTVTPGNHIDSIQFYLFNGFRIGGLDTEFYMGTVNEGKKDVILYRG